MVRIQVRHMPDLLLYNYRFPRPAADRGPVGAATWGFQAQPKIFAKADIGATQKAFTYEHD